MFFGVNPANRDFLAVTQFRTCLRSPYHVQTVITPCPRSYYRVHAVITVSTQSLLRPPRPNDSRLLLGGFQAHRAGLSPSIVLGFTHQAIADGLQHVLHGDVDTLVVHRVHDVKLVGRQIGGHIS